MRMCIIHPHFCFPKDRSTEFAKIVASEKLLTNTFKTVKCFLSSFLAHLQNPVLRT